MVQAGYRDAQPPHGRALGLARSNVLGVVGALMIPAALVAIVIPALRFGLTPASVIGLLFLVAGLALVVAGYLRSRPEYTLVLDPRGVFLVSAAGVVEGIVGSPPLTLTPGHYVYRARNGAYEKQCVWLGHRFAIGTNGIGTLRFRVPVPQMPLPRYYLRGRDWEAFVEAVPALRDIQ